MRISIPERQSNSNRQSGLIIISLRGEGMKTILMFPILMLTGCAGMPGQLSKSTSSFDGKEIIRIEPAWVYSGWKGTPFKLGIHHNSQMGPNEAVLTALAGSATIGGEPSLAFSFNGSITNLTSMDSANEFVSEGLHVWGTKRYTVSTDLLKRLAETTNVSVRLHLTRDYYEGRISSDAPGSFRPALKRFLRALE